MLQELEKQFTGVAEIKGFIFTQISKSEHAYLYEVTNSGINPHYEVFMRKKGALLIDFEKRLYSETEFKDMYPKQKSFGVWAWTCKTLSEAKIKFEQLSKNK